MIVKGAAEAALDEIQRVTAYLSSIHPSLFDTIRERLAELEAERDSWKDLWQTVANNSLGLLDRVAELEDFARDIRDNWDCDEDAHRYDTPCRCCMAAKLLPPQPATARSTPPEAPSLAEKLAAAFPEIAK